MSIPISAQALVTRFCACLAERERSGFGMEQGREPRSPFVVFFHGEASIRCHEEISRGLTQLWPQYGSSLLFVGVLHNGDGFTYELLGIDENHAARRESVSSKDVANLVSQLYDSEKSEYRDKSQLFVFHILDTSEHKTSEEFAWWYDEAACLSHQLHLDILNHSEVTFVLLDESIARYSQSRHIRDYLGNIVASEQKTTMGSVFLLSNRLADNSFHTRRDRQCDIVVAAIALANDGALGAASSFLSGGLKTIAYSRMEKPAVAIGITVVRALLSHLSADQEPEHHDSLFSELASNPERLGLTRGGTVKVLNDYVDNTLMRCLPSAEELSSFPRCSPTGPDDVRTLSSRDFDELVLGSWHVFLERMARDVCIETTNNVSLARGLRTAYGAQLQESFTSTELIELAQHIDEVEGLFSVQSGVSGSAAVLDDARARLEEYLSSNSQLTALFVSEIEHQGDKALKLRESWEALMRSVRELHRVRSDEPTLMYVPEFYGHLIDDFFDRRGAEVQERLKSVREEDDLSPFFDWLLDSIIDYHEVFTAPFELELELRLAHTSDVEAVQRTIRNILLGDGLVTYFSSDFAFAEPSSQSMLLKSGGALEQNMRAALSEVPYFYDTGQSAYAETVRVCPLNSSNLFLAGEE